MSGLPPSFKANPETSALRERSLDEIGELVTEEEMVGINEHQNALRDDVLGFLDRPLPDALRASNPMGRIALRTNTATYDDETEDRIADDTIVRKLYDLPNEGKRAPALRSRRTVVAYLLEHGLEVEPVKKDERTIVQSHAPAA